MTDPRLSIIPAAAVLDQRLKARDLQVLCLFGRHTDKRGWCTRSQVKMAKEIGCARSTVQGSIDRLVAAGWLRRTTDGHCSIIFPAEGDVTNFRDVPEDREDIGACDGSGLRALVDRFGGRCWYCGCEVEARYAGASNPRSPTRDHMTPRCKGGTNRSSNLVLACRSCNSEKRDRDVDEYRDFLWWKTGAPVVFFGEVYK